MDGIVNVSKRGDWAQIPTLPVNCPDGSVLVNLNGATRWYGGNTEENGLLTIKGKCKNIYSGEKKLGHIFGDGLPGEIGGRYTTKTYCQLLLVLTELG